MEIKTEFNVGDTVYFFPNSEVTLNNPKYYCSRIKSINIYVEDGFLGIKYSVYLNKVSVIEKLKSELFRSDSDILDYIKGRFLSSKQEVEIGG